MKHTRLTLLIVATSLAATPAIAASLTMLQFGSFETRADAEKRLNEIAKKHPAAIGKLGVAIREVKLPPDNLTVYRTQAGPVENRAAAQSICATLSAAGDECYIVQTAMTSSADVAKPAPTPMAATPPAAPVGAAAASVVSELEKSAPLTTDLTSKLSTLSEPTTRDASNVKALESIAAPTLEVPPASMVDAAPVLAAPSPEMKAALEKAASEQAAAELSVKTATDDIKKPRRSFWSRINPFSSDEDEPVKPAPAKLVAPTAAPVEEVTSKAVEVLPPATLPPVNEARSAPVVVEPKPMEVVSAKPVASLMPATAEPLMIDTAPVVITQADPLPLPPPPAPLKASDREWLAAARDKQPAVKPTTAPMPTGSLDAVELPPLPPVDGTVQVEEATRVPVTEGAMGEPKLVKPAPVVPIQPPVSLNPNATDGQKSIWAQVGPFANSDAALAYWASYRQKNPDFPVVRVRVTTPLAQQVRGSTESWLRVGPVTREVFVKSLCAKVLTPTSKLRCGTVADTGVSSAPKAMPGMLPSSRYSR